MTAKETGVKLKTWRERAGLTQTALALELEISQEFVSQIESGKKTPSLGVAASIERRTDGEVTLQDWVEPLEESKGAA